MHAIIIYMAVSLVPHHCFLCLCSCFCCLCFCLVFAFEFWLCPGSQKNKSKKQTKTKPDWRKKAKGKKLGLLKALF